MKNSVEKIYKNGALSKLGKRAAVMLLCLCLMVSFVQNVAFKATYAETVSGSDLSAVQEETAAEESVVPEAPAEEEPDLEVSTPEVSTPEVSTSDKKDEPAPVLSSSDTEETEPAPVVSSSDGEETVSGSDIDDALAADVTEKHQVVAGAVDVLGAPSGNLVAEGTSGTCSWAIDDAGVLTIYPTDGVSGVLESGDALNSWGWHDYRADVTSVVVESGVVCGSNVNFMFSDMTNCTSMNLANLNTSNVTSAAYMFTDSKALTALDLSGWNTSNVTDMTAMFRGCGALASLDVSGWNTSNVTDMTAMFSSCSALTSLDLSDFDTSNVTEMDTMFYGCSSLTSLDVTSFNTSNVTTMQAMFRDCKSLTTLDVSGFDTSKTTNLSRMFTDCSSLISLDVDEFDTSNVTDMSSMFSSCRSLTTLDVSGFDTSNVTTIATMFYNCSKLTEIDVSEWKTGNIKQMSTVFQGCGSVTELDVSKWDTSSATNMMSMFNSCSKLTSLDVSNFDTSNVTNISWMFSNCGALTSIDVTSFDTSSVTDMSYLFNNCGKLTSLDISSFDTSAVQNMQSTFSGCKGLNEIIVGTDWIPATNYEAENSANFFNVVDGTLIVKPKTGYAVKSVTVDGVEVEPEFDEETGTYTYAGFTGDSVATIIYDKGYTVTFMDGETEVEKQTVVQGGDAIDPYADTANRPEKPGYEFIGWDKEFTNVQNNLTVNAQWKLALEPQITFTTSKTVGESLTIQQVDLHEQGALYIDWGDGNLVQCAESAESAMDIKGTVAGTGEIKVYSTKNIRVFSCRDQKVTSIDISNCPELNELNLSGNELTELDLSGYEALHDVNCQDNQLTSINVDGCMGLELLQCDNNQLTELDVSDCIYMVALTFSGNQLTEIDLTNNRLISTVNAAYNQLTKMAFHDDAVIVLFACSYNKLLFSTIGVPEFLSDSIYATHPQEKVTIPAETEANTGVIDLSSEYDIYGNTTVYTWYDAADDSVVTPKTAEGGKFTFDSNTEGKSLYCKMQNAYYPDLTLETTETKITFGLEPQITFTTDKAVGETLNIEINVVVLRGHPSVIYVDLGDGNPVPYTFDASTYDCKITAPVAGTGEIKIYSERAFKKFICPDNKVTSIDVSNCPTLDHLDCKNNLLTELGLSNNTELELLNCSNNLLDELDVSNNLLINTINCNSNNLTELDVSNNLNLKHLYCSSNNLTELDVSNNSLLVTLECAENQIEELDVSGLTSLKNLWCEYNKITKLTLANCISLANFYCDCNELTELDVSDCTKLSTFYCYGNKLTELDVSNNARLGTLDCGSNNIAELDLSNNPVLSSLYCDTNNIKELDLSNNPELSDIYCNDNQLTKLDLNGCEWLYEVVCENNKLLFSTMEIPYFPENMQSHPQAIVEIPAETEINVGVVDLSSEYDIYGNTTVYTWYDAADDSVVTPKTAEGGKFTFGIDEVGKSLYCTMTNAYYPDLTLTTTATKIVAREFTLYFDVNGGNALPSDKQSKTVIYSEPVGELPVPTREGHTFAGWLDGMSVEYTADTVYMVEGDTTVYAAWTPDEYDVIYNVVGEKPANAELPANETVTYGTKYTAKLPEVISGYTFDGWYTDENCLTKYKDGTTITEDKDLYGRWTRNLITVKGRKIWVENGEGFTRPDFITIELYCNDEFVNSIDIPKGNTKAHNYSFYRLYETDENGIPYVYTIREKDIPEGYISVVSGYNITNTFNVDTFIISKSWDNTGNPDEIPESVDVEFLCDDALYKTVTLTKENGWTQTVTVPRLSAEGHTFTVNEIAVPGFSSAYETPASEDTDGDGVADTITYVIKNTYIMPKITVSGDIEWENVPNGKTVPDMNVSLMLDGEVIDTVTVPSGTESYEFTSLDRYDDEGNALAYTVKAEAVANYDTAYSAPVTDAEGNIDIDITNTGKFAYGTLTVTNFVTGNDADPSLTFSFKVEIDAPGSYECRIVNATKSKSFSLKAVGDVYTVQSGDVIELAGGESAVISGILDGTAYSVTELDSKGYKVTSTGEKGNVTAEGASAVFTNTKNREVKGESDIPDTGDDYNKPLVIGITAGFALLLAVCVVSAVVSKKRKNAAKNEEVVSSEETEE